MHSDYSGSLYHHSPETNVALYVNYTRVKILNNNNKILNRIYSENLLSSSEFTGCHLLINNVLKFMQAPLLYGLLVPGQ